MLVVVTDVYGCRLPLIPVWLRCYAALLFWLYGPVVVYPRCCYGYTTLVVGSRFHTRLYPNRFDFVQIVALLIVTFTGLHAPLPYRTLLLTLVLLIVTDLHVYR